MVASAPLLRSAASLPGAGPILEMFAVLVHSESLTFARSHTLVRALSLLLAVSLLPRSLFLDAALPFLRPFRSLNPKP